MIKQIKFSTFFVMFILFISCKKEVPVVVSFQFSLNRNEAPSLLSITNNSSGAKEYKWRFSGSNTELSLEKEPDSILYTNPGTYTIILEASNDFQTKTDTISFVLGPINSGLVAYYPFNGNANDSTLIGSNGIVYGAHLMADRNGVPNSAFEFDGIDDYIEIDSKKEQSASLYQLSISAWVKIKSFSNNNGSTFIFQKTMKNNHSSDWGLKYADKEANQSIEELRFMGELYTPGNNSGGTFTLIGYKSEIEPELEKWYHIFINYDLQDKEEIFINGKSASSVGYGSNTHSFWENNAKLIIGKDFESKTYFNGTIDDIRLYNRILTSKEVEYLFSLDH